MNLKSIFSSVFKKSVSASKGALAAFASYAYSLVTFVFRNYIKSWVYACINTIAEAVSVIDVKLQRMNGRGEWEDIDEAKANDNERAALRTLRNANPNMTTSQLFYSVPSWVEAEGNCFWLVVRNANGLPLEIYPLESDRVDIKPNNDGTINHYQFHTMAGGITQIPPEEIVHFRRYNILNRYRGMGTLEAVREEVDMDTDSTTYTSQYYRSGGAPGAILETASNTLTQDQKNDIKKKWRSEYQGRENAHKIAILTGGMKYIPNTIKLSDMQHIEGRKMSRDTIIAIFRVPPVLLGILENANRANIEGAEYIFAKYRVKPYMDLIVDHLNEFYLAMCKLDPAQYRFALRTNPVPRDEKTILAKHTAAHGRWMTVNEIRAEEGLESIEGGDEIATNPTMPQITPDEEDPQQSEGAKKKITKARKLTIQQGQDKLLTKQQAKSTKNYQKFLDQTQEQLLKKLKEQKSFTLQVIKGSPKTLTEKIAALNDLRIRQKAEGEELAELLFEDWEDMIGILYNSIKDDYDIGLAYGGKVAIAQVNNNIKFDVANERAQAWIADTALQNARTILGTLKDDLRQVILTAVQEGYGTDGVAEALMTHYSNLEEWKATMIAQTELCRCYSQGTLEGYRQSDVVKGKIWQSEDPCDVCQGNSDDGAIGLDQNFSSGDDAPPGHPRCRCWLNSVLKKD